MGQLGGVGVVLPVRLLEVGAARDGGQTENTMEGLVYKPVASVNMSRGGE